MQIEYDLNLSCYVLYYSGEAICLKSKKYEDAEVEAQEIIETWK